MHLLKAGPRSRKILGLERMRAIGLPVPPFEVIPDFELLADNTPTLDEVNSDWSPLRQAVLGAMNRLLPQAADGYSLRSASTDEDGEEASSVGRYLTFNGLSSVDAVCGAAVAIWSHHRSNAEAVATCPLIIQATHPSYFGGVIAMWTTDDGARRPHAVHAVVESYFGSARSVVDGLVAPFRSELAGDGWVHSLESPTAKSRFIAHRRLFKEPTDALSAGVALIPMFEPFVEGVRVYCDSPGLELDLYGNRPSAPPAWYSEICKDLLAMAGRLIDHGSVDIEWGCSPLGEIALYQVRPLTKMLPARTPQAASTPRIPLQAGVLSGLPASPGRARGRVWVAKGDGQPAGRILFVPGTSRPDAKALSKSRAVVASHGGTLSHIAIACRELGVPCVTGVGESLLEGAAVIVDGDAGTVSPTGKSSPAVTRGGDGRLPQRGRPKSGVHLRIIDEHLWLFDLSTQSGNQAFVHVPLVYASTMAVEHEAYARALVSFARLIDGNRSLQGAVVDGVVFRYESSGYPAFRARCLEEFGLRRGSASAAARRSIWIRRRLPGACLAAERHVLSKTQIDSRLLARLFDLISDAIMINLANPLVESAVMLAREMFGGQEDFDALYRELVVPPSFSHLAYFDAELDSIVRLAQAGLITTDDIERFVWVAGFLGPAGRGRSPFESVRYVAEFLKLPPGFIGGRETRPLAHLGPINAALDPTGLTDAWSEHDNQIVHLLMLMRQLQVLEESRHYWQARAMRMFRMVAGNERRAESQQLADYLAR